MARPHPSSGAPRAGHTLIEVIIAATLIVVILLGALNVITRDNALSREVLHTANVEQLAQEMLFRIEHELANASGCGPDAVLAADLSAGDTVSMTVDLTLGFPPRGVLLVDRGTPNEERIAYDALSADQVTFQSLERGEQCTEPSGHPAGTELIWAGLAEPIYLPGVPPPSLWDGQVTVLGETRFFRGDGTGFSYRVPVDPAGGTDFLNGDDVQWGAEINEASTLSGWVALYFQPRVTYAEADSGVDLNADGDTLDTFDIGQIRRRAWDTNDPGGPAADFGLGPTAIVQERCNWGGDLDGDGFDDPMFLWDESRRQLNVRLFLLGSLSGRTVVRKVESLMFLRNEFEG